MVKIDYITATTKGRELEDFDAPKGGKHSVVQWAAGKALYIGDQYEYDTGTLWLVDSELQGSLLRASGDIANVIAGSVPQSMRLARLDLCIDVEREIDLYKWYTLQKERSNKVTASLLDNETLYIGSRHSQRYWRVYNKAKEQGLKGALYRIEVELKAERAQQAKECLYDEGVRVQYFKANAIGVIKDLLESILQEEVSLDLRLSRKKANAERFFQSVIVPFLRKHPKYVHMVLERLGKYV